MKLNFFTAFFKGKPKPETKVISVTSQRTGEGTLLGVENFLGSIAVPEPFSLKIAGDVGGVTLLARCRDGSFVRQQLGVHYRHARVSEVSPQDDPLRLAPGEQAWSMDLRLRGPEYLPLCTFRDDDLLDQGSDPLISVIGSLSDLEPGSAWWPGCDFSPWAGVVPLPPGEGLPPVPARPAAASPYHAQATRTDVGHLAALGVPALPALQGFLWVQQGETWKAAHWA